MCDNGERPQIFISHSSNTDPDTAGLLDRLSAGLCAAGMDVLVDKERLNLGDSWRREINLWLQECHAGVILLSPGALNSRWVAIEAAILVNRRYIDQNFVVIPVRLPGVTREQLSEGFWATININEIQALRADAPGSITAVAGEAPDVVMDRIVSRLGEVRDRLAAGPARELQRTILPWLQELRDVTLEDLAGKLNLAQPWRTGTLPNLLARELLKADLAMIKRVWPTLQTQLNPRRTSQLRDILACAWVPVDIVEPMSVLGREDGAPGVAVNTQLTFTAYSYVARTCPFYPGWPILEVSPRSGESTLEALRGRIRKAYLKAIGSKSAIAPDRIDRRLKAKADDKWPWIVVLPASPEVDAAILAQLRKEYAGVRFFVLAGNNATDAGAYANLPAIFVEPAIDSDVEDTASEWYDQALRLR